jgi:hypothetical protein
VDDQIIVIYLMDPQNLSYGSTIGLFAIIIFVPLIIPFLIIYYFISQK